MGWKYYFMKKDYQFNTNFLCQKNKKEFKIKKERCGLRLTIFCYWIVVFIIGD